MNNVQCCKCTLVCKTGQEFTVPSILFMALDGAILIKLSVFSCVFEQDVIMGFGRVLYVLGYQCACGENRYLKCKLLLYINC